MTKSFNRKVILGLIALLPPSVGENIDYQDFVNETGKQVQNYGGRSSVTYLMLFI